MFLRTAIIAMFFLAPFTGYAQEREFIIPTGCMPKKAMLNTLSIKYGEKPVALGLTPGPLIFQLMVNLKTRTWSVVLTGLNNMSCLISSGTEMEFAATGLCYRRSNDVKSNFGDRSASLAQTSYRQICAQGSSQMDTASERAAAPPLPR